MASVIIITLIVTLGGAILWAAVWAVRILRRMERRQGAAVASLRILTSPDAEEQPQPAPSRHLTLLSGGAGAAMVVALFLRRHWLPVATTVVGLGAASTVAVALTFGQSAAPGGASHTDSRPTVATTAATTALAPTEGLAPPPPSAPIITVTTVVLAGGAPIVTTITAPSPSAAPASGAPAPSSSTTGAAASPTPTVKAKPTAEGAPCVVTVTVPSLVGICLI